MLALLAAPRRRPGWQWLVLGVGARAGAHLRHRDAVHLERRRRRQPLFLQRLRRDAVPAAADRVDRARRSRPGSIGGLFVAPMVLNPFAASFKPADNAKTRAAAAAAGGADAAQRSAGLQRSRSARRVWFGELGQGDPGFLVYFLDDNAYGREADKSFWTRGESRAEFVIKIDRPIRRATFTVAAGPVPADVTITVDGRQRACTSSRRDRSRSPMSDAAGLALREGGPGRAALERAHRVEQRRLHADLLRRERRPTRVTSACASSRCWKRDRSEDRRRDLEPADGRGRAHGDRARADARARRRRARRRTSSSRPQNALRPPGVAPTSRPGSPTSTSSEGRPIDQVISLRYPSYAVRHPRHVCWLNHTMREYYDLWAAFSATLSPQGRVKERVRRDASSTPPTAIC